MPRGRAMLAAGVCTLLLPAPAAPVPHAWTSAPLPIARATLVEILDLPPDIPRSLLLFQAVRALHEDDLRGGTRRRRIAAALDTPAATPVSAPELVPLPGEPEVWTRIGVASGSDAASVIRAVLNDERTGFFYYGLASLDDRTREYVVGHPALLHQLASEHSGAFAGAAKSLRVHNGIVQVPGGPPAEETWRALVGASPARPEAFIPRLLGQRHGRLAYFFDALGHLPAGHVRFALGLDPEGAAHLDIARGVAQVFVGADPTWSFAQRPFTRMPYDPGTLVQQMEVTPGGALVGPSSQDVWRAILERRAASGETGLRDDGPRVDAGWLLRRLTVSDWGRRRDGLAAVLFVQRMAAAAAAHPVEWLPVVAALADMPALVFALERMGIADHGTYLEAVSAARAISARPGHEQSQALRQWQSALAILDRIVQRSALSAGRAAVLVRELSAVPRPARKTRGATRLEVAAHVTRWFRGHLLPALADADERPGTQSADEGENAPSDAGAGSAIGAGTTAAEHEVVRALAGGASRYGTAVLTWEGHRYRVDNAASDRHRLQQVRAAQDGNTLDAALRLVELAAPAATDAGSTVRGDALVKLARTLRPVDAGDGHMLDVAARARAMGTLLGESTPSRGAVARARPALEDAADDLLADVLTSIAYAPFLGDAESRVFLGGNLASRHDLELDARHGDGLRRYAWHVPEEYGSPGRPWHLRGSLLGLDFALGPLALRRLLGEMPAREPAVTAPERRALLAGLLLIRPSELDDAALGAALDAVARGRERLRAEARHAAGRARACDNAGVCGWRAEVLAWTAAHEPEALAATALRSELAWLGTSDRAAVLQAAWGAALWPLDGSWRLRFPRAEPVEHYTGRPATAHVLVHSADLKLRVGEWLADLGLPLALLPAVLRVAMQEYLDTVRPAYPDDWLAFVRHCDGLDRARVEDYVAVLTAVGGPLVPAGEESLESPEP